MGREREAGFVAGDIERDDSAAAKFLDEASGRHALRFGEMPQRAENQACLDAGFANQAFD